MAIVLLASVLIAPVARADATDPIGAAATDIIGAAASVSGGWVPLRLDPYAGCCAFDSPTLDRNDVLADWGGDGSVHVAFQRRDWYGPTVRYERIEPGVVPPGSLVPAKPLPFVATDVNDFSRYALDGLAVDPTASSLNGGTVHLLARSTDTSRCSPWYPWSCEQYLRRDAEGWSTRRAAPDVSDASPSFVLDPYPAIITNNAAYFYSPCTRDVTSGVASPGPSARPVQLGAWDSRCALDTPDTGDGSSAGFPSWSDTRGAWNSIGGNFGSRVRADGSSAGIAVASTNGASFTFGTFVLPGAHEEISNDVNGGGYGPVGCSLGTCGYPGYYSLYANPTGGTPTYISLGPHTLPSYAAPVSSFRVAIAPVGSTNLAMPPMIAAFATAQGRFFIDYGGGPIRITDPDARFGNLFVKSVAIAVDSEGFVWLAYSEADPATDHWHLRVLKSAAPWSAPSSLAWVPWEIESGTPASQTPLSIDMSIGLLRNNPPVIAYRAGYEHHVAVPRGSFSPESVLGSHSVRSGDWPAASSSASWSSSLMGSVFSPGAPGLVTQLCVFARDVGTAATLVVRNDIPADPESYALNDVPDGAYYLEWASENSLRDGSPDPLLSGYPSQEAQGHLLRLAPGVFFSVTIPITLPNDWNCLTTNFIVPTSHFFVYEAASTATLRYDRPDCDWWGPCDQTGNNGWTSDDGGVTRSWTDCACHPGIRVDITTTNVNGPATPL